MKVEQPLDLAPLTVWLVDDDPDHVLIITRAIRSVDARITVHALPDGSEALDALRDADQPPDLILLDISMPGLTGFDVLSSVKQDERLRLIPVVMLTSSDLDDDIARAYQLGASGYISKTSYLHDLRAVLGNTLLYWSVMRKASATKSQMP
jgi:CheY-like chemotaxis protein